MHKSTDIPEEDISSIFRAEMKPTSPEDGSDILRRNVG
jgi:hypothetical protein